MKVETIATVKSCYIRTRDDRKFVSLSLLIPTTIKDKVSGECRMDTIDATYFGGDMDDWENFKGKVNIIGDLRVNRYLRDGAWQCSPSILINGIRKVK